jgi:hypothetical protein
MYFETALKYATAWEQIPKTKPFQPPVLKHQHYLTTSQAIHQYFSTTNIKEEYVQVLSSLRHS